MAITTILLLLLLLLLLFSLYVLLFRFGTDYKTVSPLDQCFPNFLAPQPNF
jgi:hypothetical protein